MPIYRNYTPTMTRIQDMGTMHITNSQEAVAFLRALQPLLMQMTVVLQKASINKQHAKNVAAVQAAPAPAPVTPAPEPTPEAPFTPEPIEAEEEHSAADKAAKVAKLKKAAKK